MRQQVRDEGERSDLAQQQRQGVDRLLCSELRARQVLEVARVPDAQAPMLRRSSNMQARLLLLEAEHCATILPEEGQERWRVTWEAGWATRQRDMSIWETRCRLALLGVLGEGRGTGQMGSGHSVMEAK